MFAYLPFFSLVILSINAMAIDKRGEYSMTINGYSYTVVDIAEQGTQSQTYDIVGGFNNHPAVLKMIRKEQGDDRTAIDQEVSFSEKTGQFLYFSDTDDQSSYLLVMRNVRHNFPTNSSPERKFAYEWYIEGKDVVNSLEKISGNIKKRGMDYATQDGVKLAHRDVKYNNVLMDETFEDIEFIDWAPGFDDDEGEEFQRGVKEIDASQIAEYDKDLDRIIPMTINIRELNTDLLRHGEALRKEDEPALKAEKKAARKKKN